MPKIRIIREIRPKITVVSTKSQEGELEKEIDESEEFTSGGNFSDIELMQSSGGQSPTLEMSGERQELPQVPEEAVRPQTRQPESQRARIQGQAYEAAVRDIEEEERAYRAVTLKGPGGEISMAESIRRTTQDIQQNRAFERRALADTTAFEEDQARKYEMERDEQGRVKRRMPWE